MYPPPFPNFHYWWYPIGNTPAVDLLRTTRCNDQGKVRVLSIACGDVRNILYTLFCERGFGAQRSYEIIACDYEPAILARNVLILSLLVDLSKQPKSSRSTSEMLMVWRIYYHTSVLKEDLRKIQEQSQKLADCTLSLSSWVASPYGKIFSLLTYDTLQRLRRYWLLYADTQGLTPQELAAFDDRMKQSILLEIQENMKDEENFSTNTIRSTGAHCSHTTYMARPSSIRYTETGVAGGNKSDRDLLDKQGGGHGNPTFAFSSSPEDKYAVHYASNPLDGFHLAHVYDKDVPAANLTEEAVRAAKTEFSTWCDAFVAMVGEHSRIQLIVHCGDALNLCYQLQKQNITSVGASFLEQISLYVGHWTSVPLVFDGTITIAKPVYFDVIDTSNLVDHVGILNVLAAAAPLLRPNPLSVLNTENLMVQSQNLSHWLDEDLCMDASTMSILIGLIPCDYVLRETAYSNEWDSYIMQHPQEGKSYYAYRLQTSWKHVYHGHAFRGTTANKLSQTQQTYIEMEEFSDLLTVFYTRLLLYSDVDVLSDALQSTLRLDNSSSRDWEPLHRSHRKFYSTLTFVAILAVARHHIVTDWGISLNSAMKKIRSLEIQLRSDAPSPSLEMLFHLALFDSPSVCVDQILYHPQLEDLDALVSPGRVSELLRQVNPAPVTLHLALVLPFDQQQKLRLLPRCLIGNTGLSIRICETANQTTHTFTMLHCFFGSLKPDPEDKALSCVSEDLSGWAGSSDLIVSCSVPCSALFPLAGDAVSISLALNNHHPVPVLDHLFGPNLTIWESSISDPRSVRILSAAPMGSRLGKMPEADQTKEHNPVGKAPDVSAHVSQAAKIDWLSHRSNFDAGSEHSKSLAEGGKVSVSQTGPCTMTVQIGDEEPCILCYPFPVNGSITRAKVARKSSWVEISVPVSPVGADQGFNIDPFPVAFVESQPHPWQCPRVNVDQQPVIERKGSLDWLQPHLASTLSIAEMDILRYHPRETPGRPINGTVDFKQTFNLLLTCFAGVNHLTNFRKFNGFGLFVKDKGEVLLYVKAVRHDHGTHSVLLDAWLIQQEFSPSRLLSQDFNPVMISEAECPIWRQMLFNAAERCRSGWIHRGDCEYRNAESIPLPGPIILCSCGQGKAVTGFPRDSKMRILSKKATRVALYPVFATVSRGSAVKRSLQTPSATSTIAVKPLRSEEHGPGCNHCGTIGSNLKHCGRCGIARYCSPECQKAEWKEHKKVCKQ